MDIDSSVTEQVGEASYTRWKDAALADLADIMCAGSLEESTTPTEGIVEGEGLHVALSSWYSSVTGVQTTDGTSLDYCVAYELPGSDDTRYARTLTIAQRLPVGTVLTIQGTHGFSKLPDQLNGVLAAIIEADQSVLEQTDRITSKAIEDVNVNYATITETAMQRALTPYRSLINKWSLCRNGVESGGILSMPRKHCNLPWWLNPQDYVGGDYAYGNAL